MKGDTYACYYKRCVLYLEGTTLWHLYWPAPLSLGVLTFSVVLSRALKRNSLVFLDSTATSENTEIRLSYSPFAPRRTPRQEFLPRALVVEFCMEDEGEAGGHNNPHSRPDRTWFSRATQLLRQILEEWKRQRFPAAGREGGSPGLGPSPEAVAEAILNSVHCCVAAVGASLVFPMSGKPGSAKRQQDLDRNVGAEGVGREAGVGMTKEGGLTGPLDLPVAQALRRIGEMVGVAAGLDQLGDALLRRCSSLLAKPNRCVVEE